MERIPLPTTTFRAVHASLHADAVRLMMATPDYTRAQMMTLTIAEFRAYRERIDDIRRLLDYITELELAQHDPR